MQRKPLLQVIAMPLFFLALLITIYALWNAFNLPRTDEIILMMQGWFQTYGLWLMSVNGLIEGLAFVGMYYPGTLVIFLGVVLMDSLLDVLIVGLMTLAGLMVAYALDYYIGTKKWCRRLMRLGISKPFEVAQGHIREGGARNIFWYSWMPNVTTFMATAAGVEGVGWWRTMWELFKATVIWGGGWILIFIFIGDEILEIFGIQILFLLIIIWMVSNVVNEEYRLRKK